MMNIKTFASLLDTYGPDPANWPERKRADGLALAASDAEARAALADARRLDALLNEAASFEADSALETAILRSAPSGKSATGPVRTVRWGGWAIPSGAAMASLVFGLTIGSALSGGYAEREGTLASEAEEYLTASLTSFSTDEVASPVWPGLDESDTRS